MKKKDVLLVIFFLVLANIEFLVIPYLVYGHDMNFHLSRIEGIIASIKSGVFPALIYPNYLNGYGYPNGIFYADIFLYIPSILVLLGMSVVNAYKVFMILINIGIFISMYFSVKKITKNTYVSMITGLMYLTCSYKISDMFLRAAVGETLSFVFFPLFFLGIYSIFYGNKKDWYYYTLGIVGISFSHNLSLFMCILVTLVMFIINIKEIYKDKIRLIYLLVGGIFSILISLCFIGPLMEAMVSDSYLYNNLVGSDMVVERAANALYSIIEIPSGKKPWQPLGVGVIFIILGIYLRKVKVKKEKDRKCAIDFLILGIFFLFMATSLFPWNYFKSIFGVIQFPWRFYILVTLFFFLGFSILLNNKDINKKVFTPFICLVMIMTTTIGFLYHYRFDPINRRYNYISNGEYIPDSLNRDYLTKDGLVYVITRGDYITSNNSNIEYSFTRNGIVLDIEYSNNYSDDTYLELPLIYYKGYKAKENDNYLKVERSSNGLVQISLSGNSGNIHVYYGFTNIRIISYIVSFISVIIFIIVVRSERKAISKDLE